MCLYLNTCILLLRYAKSTDTLQTICKNELILVRLNGLLMETHI